MRTNEYLAGSLLMLFGILMPTTAPADGPDRMMMLLRSDLYWITGVIVFARAWR